MEVDGGEWRENGMPSEGRAMRAGMLVGGGWQGADAEEPACGASEDEGESGRPGKACLDRENMAALLENGAEREGKNYNF